MRFIPRFYINFGIKDIVALAIAIFQKKNQLDKINNQIIDWFQAQYEFNKVFLTSSGRASLLMILESMGIKEGDEVIVSAYNFHVIPSIIKALGAVPVFVDVNPDTCDLSYEKLKNIELTGRTKAIVITHLFGRPCKDTDKIVQYAKKNNLFVMEDCAQALDAEFKGKKVGTFGDCAFFSFSLGKSLGPFGGSALGFMNMELAKGIKEPKGHEPIWKTAKKALIFSYVSFFSLPLMNLISYLSLRIADRITNHDLIHMILEEKSEVLAKKYLDRLKKRMSLAQGCLALRKLKTFRKSLKLRIRNGEIFYKGIKNKNVKPLQEVKYSKNIFLTFPLFVKRKHKFRRYMLKKRIDIRADFMYDCPGLQMFSREYLINSRNAKKHMVHLPVDCNLSKKDVLRIIKACNEYKDY